MNNNSNTRSRSLLIWLILLTLAALLCGILAIVFGFLINMDTKIEMNPNGDPLVRQDAIGFRLIAWVGVAVFVLLLSVGVIGAWRERGRQRPQRAFGLSLLAAVPIFLAASAFTWILVSNGP
jgi:uncharacterized BrkB/YihY/UPF0761 family membrane protein